MDVYLYSKLDDVKRERVVFSTTCLRSRRSRAQLRQCVVLLSVKNNVTKRGKKSHYFGGARSKGFATLRNVSKLQFFDKIGRAKSVGFWFYSAI